MNTRSLRRAALLAALIACPAGAQGSLFPTSYWYQGGNAPYGSALACVDGDEHLDFVVANYYTNTVSIFLGTGTGLFTPLGTVTVGGQPRSLTVADLNGDGNPDLATANSSTNKVAVRLGDGNGGFVPGANLYAPNPKGLAVGDLSGDGVLDIAIASSQFDMVQVFIGTGGGGFLAPRDYPVGDYPTAVMIGEFTGDDRPDLITAEASSDTLTVLVGVGEGDFGFAHTSPVPEPAYHAVSADLNGDGISDVVTSNQTKDSLRVHMGGGTGAWERYCAPKSNSLGCVPAIWAEGTPSTRNTRPFMIRVTNVLNSKPGIFIYQVNGAQASIPFQGGTLCMTPPGIRRSPVVSSGGYPPPVYDCTGVWGMDFNAFAAGLGGGNPDPGLLVPGNHYLVQVWGRDPGFAPPNNVALSDALEVVPFD